MDIRTKLDLELKDAMRAGDEMKKQNIRMVLSAIRLAEIEKGVKLEDPGIVSIIQKEMKTRSEALEDAKRAGRDHLVDHALKEIKYLETFLPEQLTEEELENIIRKTIMDLGATSLADMGKVMKAVMSQVHGVASGDQVSKLAKKLLQT